MCIKQIKIVLFIQSGSCGTIRTINSSSTTPDKFELLESLPRDMSTTTQEPEEDDSASAVVSLDETDPGDKEWTRLQLPRVNITERSSVLPTISSRLLYTYLNCYVRIDIYLLKIELNQKMT